MPVSQAYVDGSRLSARISSYQWQRPAFDLVGLALERLTGTTGTVLDVGWGTGTYTSRLRKERPDLRVVPLDLSPGLRPEVVGEVDRLPFATASAGAVLAMHMLYYARDKPAAIAELARVLAPGGRLVVSTNGHAAKREFAALWTFALRDLGIADPPPYPRIDGSFLLHDARRLLTDAFGQVEAVERRTEVVVPEADPVIAFLDRMGAEQARHLPPGVTWPDYLAAAARRVRDEVVRTGAYRLTGHVGVLTADRGKAGIIGAATKAH